MSNDQHLPIVYDYQDLIAPDHAPLLVRETGLLESDKTWLTPRLAACRQEVLDDLTLYRSKKPIPREKDPLDAAFLDVPDRYFGDNAGELQRIIDTADHLAKDCDRVVVLGIGGSYMGARALMETCCHGYHNEVSRQRRGGRPRIYFEGNNFDNDSVQHLLDLLDGDSNWGIIVISKSGGTLETAVAFRIFYDCLAKSLKGDPQQIRKRVMVVTSENSKLYKVSQALGLSPTENMFLYPDGVGGRFSVLTPVGLLPAAVMGVDVTQLLQGARDMNERFRTAAPLENPPLAYAGISRLMETRRGATIRLLSTWGKRLEAVGLWYDQLLSESLGKNGLGATPITAVNTRDLHSRGQQHQEGRRDKLITNLVVGHCDRDLVRLAKWEHDEDDLNKLAGKSLVEILDAAYRGTNKAYLDDCRRTANIRLPRLDEHAVGQLLQMLMIATVVEGRLVGINPYGQPGVEAYKKNMNEILRGGQKG